MPSSNITHDQTHSLSDSTATLAVAVSALTHCSYSHDWCVTWHSPFLSPVISTRCHRASGRTDRARPQRPAAPGVTGRYATVETVERAEKVNPRGAPLGGQWVKGAGVALGRRKAPVRHRAARDVAAQQGAALCRGSMLGGVDARCDRHLTLLLQRACQSQRESQIGTQARTCYLTDTTVGRRATVLGLYLRGWQE